MTYAQYNSITAADYDSLVGNNTVGPVLDASLNKVWAIGNANAGYGQPAVLNVAVGNTVGNLEWDSLINTTRTAASHQGSTITSVTAPSTGNTIAYLAGVTNNIVTIYNNRLNAVAQGSTSSNTITNSSPWTNNLVFTQNAYFANGDAARYFFNAGGQLVITCSHPTGTAVDNVFHNLAANIGNVTLSSPTGGTITIAGNSFSGISKVGGGGQTPTVLADDGYYALSAGNANVFTQIDGVDATFSASYINIKVKTNGTVGTNGDNGNIITFYTTWQEVPSGTTVSAGTTTTLTAIYPSTGNIANSWGTVSFVPFGPTTTTTTSTSTTTTTTIPPVLNYEYTVPGTYTIPVSAVAGYPYLTLTMVGGGGGGGGNDGYGDTRAGGGGGSGGYTNIVVNTTGATGNFSVTVGAGGTPANVTFNGISYPGIPPIPRTGTKNATLGGSSSLSYNLGSYSAGGGGGGIGNTGDNGDGVGGAGGSGLTTNGNAGVTPITDRNIYVAAAGGVSVYSGYGAGGASQNSNFGTNLNADLPQPGGNGYARLQFSSTIPTTTTTTTTTAAPVGTINTALFSYLNGSPFYTGATGPAITPSILIIFYGSGTFTIVDQAGTNLTDGAPNHQYWISGGGVNPGQYYWIKFTQTAVFGYFTTATTGWLQIGGLSGSQLAYVSNDYNGTTDSTYTIEIATDSAGTNIVATSTGVFISATQYPHPVG
jgi:hypothetical protein